MPTAARSLSPWTALVSSDRPAIAAPQSPYFRALQAPRYERQAIIRDYEETFERALIVVNGPIHPHMVAPFADAVGDLAPDENLDLMLTSLGGDGEIAYRLAAMCHGGRPDFRVVVVDLAASAATLMALAAESIVMSDVSALGPVDPQIYVDGWGDYYPAKDIIEIVDDLEARANENPQAFEYYVALLSEIDAMLYQSAVSATRRTQELVPQLVDLRRVSPNEDTVKALTAELQSHAEHSATINYQRAREIGLDVEYCPPNSDRWRTLWRLHAHYLALSGAYSAVGVTVEGRRVSFHFHI